MDTDLPFPSNHELDEEDEDDDFFKDCMEEEDKHEECSTADDKCWICFEAAERSFHELQEALATGN